MVYEEAPGGWAPLYEVVGCFVECRGAILLLLRRHHKPEGGKWGVPAGKINEGENPEQALIREIAEETGLRVPLEALCFLKKVYVRNPSYDFVYYMYRIILEIMPRVSLNYKEHHHFTWKTPEEAPKLSLVADMDACVRMTYAI